MYKKPTKYNSIQKHIIIYRKYAIVYKKIQNNAFNIQCILNSAKSIERTLCVPNRKNIDDGAQIKRSDLQKVTAF